MGDMSPREGWTKYSSEKEARLHRVIAMTTRVVLFTYGLYNNAVSSSDYEASNGMMISEQ
jgi:hypothetical protein